MDRFTSMELFVQVVERGSFTAAAADASLSATMVGKHITALEERLGGRLLNRTTRRQSLTELGRGYYDQCKRILAEIAQAEAGARLFTTTPRGTLRVTAPVSLGSQWLAPALVDYLAGHPDVQIDLGLNDRVVDLVEEGYEVGLRVGRLADTSLIVRPLAPYRLLLAASPGYIARHGRPKVPDDLARHNCLGFSLWSQGDKWRLEGRGNRVHTVKVRGNLRVNNGQALRTAACAGLGIVMQPEALLSEDLTARRLVAVLPGFSPPTRPLQLVYLRDRHMTPKLRSFIDFVLARWGLSAGNEP
jgi:DNA-binding transcriptional LysR family regulator